MADSLAEQLDYVLAMLHQKRLMLVQLHLLRMAYDHQASFLKKPKKTAGEAEVDDTYEEFT